MEFSESLHVFFNVSTVGCEHQAVLELLQGTLASQQLLMDAQQQRIAQLQQSVDFLTLENEWLRAQINREKFGPHSERTELLQTDQLPLFTPTPPLALPSLKKKTKRKRAGKKGRRSLWTDPTRVKEKRTRVFPAQTHCPDCSQELFDLGVDETVEVERIPSILERRILERVKRTCQHCKNTTVYQVPAPERTFRKIRIGDHLLSSIVVDHLEYHLPFNRIRRMLAAEGLHISRASLGHDVHLVGSVLQPIVEHVEKELNHSPWLAIDGSWLWMQQARKCRRAAVWVAHGQNDQVVFRYTETANKDDATAPWKAYSGVVMCDAADVFDPLFLPLLPQHATRCNCHAHGRRKFVQALTSDRARAEVALGFYQRLYEIEEALKDCSDSERRAQRQQQSVPILQLFHQWLASEQLIVMPRSPMAQAIQYMLNHWCALLAYTEHGCIKIDNNDSEREIRHFVVGRKNWGFRVKPEHAKTMCVLYSLLAMCRRRNLEPRAYIAWALKYCSDPSFKVQDLTPQAYQRWIVEHPDIPPNAANQDTS